jgi:hypothetical protein
MPEWFEPNAVVSGLQKKSCLVHAFISCKRHDVKAIGMGIVLNIGRRSGGRSRDWIGDLQQHLSTVSCNSPINNKLEQHLDILRHMFSTTFSLAVL